MKTSRKVILGVLIGCGLLGFGLNRFWGRFVQKDGLFADGAPVRTVPLPAPFPGNLLYQSTPDSTVLLGTHSMSRDTNQHEISAFDRTTARQLWQLPFLALVVGQTKQAILVYEAQNATVYFLEPRTGRVIRIVHPQPDPLTSPTSLYMGMAFTDDFYLTTKSLYTSVFVGDHIDTTWQIGITAKRWETNKTGWFLPPVKQIVLIEYRPVVAGDEVLIINPRQKIGEGHSYQIISLQTGKERHRGMTEGTYYPLADDLFFERTNTFSRRLDPFTQREIWRIEGSFQISNLWTVGNQLAILSRRPDGEGNTMRIVEARSGRLLRQFDLPYHNETAVHGGYLTRHNEILIHFKAANAAQPGTNQYDYWVAYEPGKAPAKTGQIRWRTDFHSESLSSLLPFINL